MANTQAMTVSEARNTVSRLRTQLKNMKEEGKRVTRLATHSTLMAAGGAGAAVLKVKMPKLPVLDLPSDVSIGTALTLAAAFDLAGDMSDELSAIGGGMLAKATGDYVEKELLKK